MISIVLIFLAFVYIGWILFTLLDVIINDSSFFTNATLWQIIKLFLFFIIQFLFTLQFIATVISGFIAAKAKNVYGLDAYLSIDSSGR